jgi:hypothetical protein
MPEAGSAMLPATVTFECVDIASAPPVELSSVKPRCGSPNLQYLDDGRVEVWSKWSGERHLGGGVYD